MITEDQESGWLNQALGTVKQKTAPKPAKPAPKPAPTRFATPDGWQYDSVARIVSAPNGRKYRYDGKEKLPTFAEFDLLKKEHAAAYQYQQPIGPQQALPPAPDRQPSQQPALTPQGYMDPAMLARHAQKTGAIAGQRFQGPLGAAEAANMIGEKIGKATSSLNIPIPFTDRYIPTGDVVGAIASTPFNIQAELDVVTRGDTTLEQKARAGINIALNAGGDALVLKLGGKVAKPLIDKALQLWKKGKRAEAEKLMGQAVQGAESAPQAPLTKTSTAPKGGGTPKVGGDDIVLYRVEHPEKNFHDVFEAEGLEMYSRPPGAIGKRYTDDPSMAKFYADSYGKGAVTKKIVVTKQQMDEITAGRTRDEYFVPDHIANPPATPPTTPKGGETGPQGIRHEDIDELRSELGWDLTDRTAKPDAQLFKEAAKHKGKEAVVAQKILADPKKTLTDSEGLALGSQLKALKEQMLEAKAKNDFDAFDNLEAEARTIADALDESGSRQGRAFRARRFLARDFDSWEFNRGVEKANIDGQPLAPKKAGYQARVAKEVDATTATLKAERDKAVADFQNLLGAVQSKRSKGPMSAAQKRTAALNSLRKLGVPVTDDVGQAAAGGMKSKQAGAINIPVGSADDIARDIRSLVRSYADEGATDWGGVMTRLQRDLPGIDEEQALFILSGKYKVAKVEADLARKKAYTFMRDVKRDAEYRMKPIAVKYIDGAIDFFNSTQRSFQTTLDNSMALIQGRNVLTWKPGTWFKAVGTSLKAFTTKSPIEFARKEMSVIENHPLYAKAVQAKLGLSDLDGPFSKQEEFFAGSLENHVPGLANSKAAATILMNKMRFDLFRKLSANAPKDAPAEFFEDIARQINVATGKGTGRVAESLGDVKAGLVAYAPRYYLSKWQHATGNALRHAKTPQGRKEAMKMYASQAVGYGSLVAAAELFGYDVEWDPRSADFGMATAKDGSYSFDVFRQASEPVRVIAQLGWGRISKKGNWTDPGEFGSYGPGDYIESKLSAVGKTLETLRKGTTFDEETGGRRVADAHDFWKSWIPLSIKEMQKQGFDWRKVPASFMGAGLDKPTAKDVKKPPPPISWPPPGVTRMKKGE